MADDLGARLVRAGLVTRDQLADVLGSAPPHEGALVAGLVERGLAADALAGYFVAAGYEPLLRGADLLSPPREALARLPAAVARSLWALPVRLGPAGLVVAMAAPTDRHVVGELERITGSPILTAPARVGELREALERAYPELERTPSPSAAAPEPEPPALELGRSPLPTGGRSAAAPRASGATAAGWAGSSRGAGRVEARALVGPRLAPEDDDAFVPLVKHKPVPRPARAPSSPRSRTPTGEPTRRGESDPRPADGPRPNGGRPRVITKEFGGAERPGGRPVRPVGGGSPRPATDGPPPTDSLRTIIPPEHDRWDLESSGSGRAPANKLDRRSARRWAAAMPKRPPRPAPIGGTVSAIRGARERDELVELLCQGALTVCRVSALLAVRRGRLEGWGVAGVGLSRDAIRNLWIPVSGSSRLRDVVREGVPSRGPPGRSAADELFRAAIGGRGGELGLCPVSVADRQVAVLAADGLRFGDEGLARLEMLCRAAGEAFERIILEAKKR